MRRTLFLVALSIAACGKKSEPTPKQGSGSGSAGPAAIATKLDQLSRAEVNRWALHENLALYWVADTDADKTIDPDEVASLLFYPVQGVWVENGAFTPQFERAYQQIVAASKAAPPDPSTPEGRRRKLIAEELDQGRPTLVHSDLRSLTLDDKAFVTQMLKVAAAIDFLYQTQTGAVPLASKLPKDNASWSVFRRNHGPKCVAPATKDNPECTAIPGAPKVMLGVYPLTIQLDDKFCDMLAKHPDNKTLMQPFVAVRGAPDKLIAVPYPEAFKQEMASVAREVAAAAELVKDPNEKPLAEYLRAAAKAFATNDWVSADEPWSRMDSTNSAWYVRVAPDEVYWDTCSSKAGAHLTLARINQRAKEWRDKLAPVQQDLEVAIAAKAGAPYAARTVTFKLPDFIDIVVNAGDDRDPLSATIGQSLPNWGKVSEESRDRTVVMLNIYTDTDSIANQRAQAESMFDAETMKTYTDDPTAQNLSTILHELTHNLGPTSGYKIAGKTPRDIFTGPISSMMEELKAQTGALFLIELLRQRKIISDELATQTYTASIAWGLRHVSEGMKDATGKPEAYANLAAIQTGFLLDKGALVWDPKKPAANGKDTGAFTIDGKKLVAACDEMMKVVGGIKARGDKKAAEELIARYADGVKVVPHPIIQERYRRFPKTSLVYSIAM